VGTLHTGDPVEVIAFVQGDMVVPVNSTWAELGPGRYVYTSGLRKPLPASPPPPAQTFSGQWIDANLTEQILTAYSGSTPVFWAVMSSGAPGGTETETGVHTILRRVANETMSSATLRAAVAIPYFLTNVLYTQYFTDYGAAIHDNYWKNATSPFGVPTSHGCMGLQESDALKFWNFAHVGTVVNIHY
jgi:lipoprotein-anchoring transpeptidase ErfK/SrfK